MNKPDKILLLEDEPLIRESLTDLLEEHGFHVKSSECCHRGLEMLKSEDFDIAIVDQAFPGNKSNGEEFISDAMQLAPKIRFLIHTANKDFELSDNLKGAGLKNEHILIKAVSDLEHILEKINATLVKST